MLRSLLASVSLPNSALAAPVRSLALSVFLLGASFTVAEAAKGLAVGTELQGFGRVVFSFDGEINAKARVLNSVLIVEFDQAVTLDVDKLSQQLPSYVSMVRADPDGRSIRLALNDRFRSDLKVAGEKVFLDILSPRWQGAPPPLPPDVVQDLVRRARAAEDQLRKMAREQEKQGNRALDLKLGTAPQFRRAIFTMPRSAPVNFSVKDDTVSLVYDAGFTLSEAFARQSLAGLIRDIDIETGPELLRITLVTRDGIKVRGFREDDSVTFDFVRADGKPFDDPSAPAAAPAGAAAPVAPGKEPATNKAVAPAPNSPATSAPAQSAPAQSAPAKAAPAKAESGKVEILPKVLEQALAASEAQPSARFEIGRDPLGFSIRLNRIGQAPIAIVRRGKTLNVLVEAPDVLRLIDIPADQRARIESAHVQALKGASLLRVAAISDAGYWLRRDGQDLILEQGRSGGTPDAYSGASVPLGRAFDPTGRAALEAKVGNKGSLFTVDDTVSGSKLTLVGAPAASFMSPKVLDFAEFSLQPTLAGLAILPLDEAVSIKRRPDAVMVSHDIRLNLSALPAEQEDTSERESSLLLLDLAGWNEDRSGDVRRAENQHLVHAAEAPRVTRSAARLRLARFYMANALYPEADAVLKVLMADDPKAVASKQVNYYRAFVAAMAGRTVEATHLLSDAPLSTEGEAQLLMGYVQAKAMHYPQALAVFRGAMRELDRYPEALQAQFRRTVIESAIEADDPVFAREQLAAYAKLSPENRNLHVQQLLAARLADQQGRPDDALAAYSLAAQSPDREIEAEARFGKAVAQLAMSKIAPEDARAEFETLSMIWRRSDVEVRALEKLGGFYAAEGRWREAFLASQRATAIMPEHVATRRLEDTMARRFESLFLKNEGDKLSKVETLAIYQEFRQLVPVGRRGDEIARHLAERLIDLDLAGEATEILEHQIKHRLEGVARASVATRLAVVYLNARQPVQALAALRTSRLAVLPPDLRRARQLLEARALGDLFRTDLAIELVADEQGDDIDRLRADIFWKGKKWRDAGESYERLLGDAWQQKEPLSEGQRLDALRAGLAYTLGDEKLSLDRLRGRYMAAMNRTEDGASFNLVTNDKFTRPQDFREVARAIVNADTMTEFMSAYRKRYPESGGQARPVRSAGDNKQSSTEPPQPVPARG